LPCILILQDQGQTWSFCEFTDNNGLSPLQVLRFKGLLSLPLPLQTDPNQKSPQEFDTKAVQWQILCSKCIFLL
jgi:hypothetical protein